MYKDSIIAMNTNDTSITAMLVKQQTVIQTRENRICEYNVHTCIFVCVYSSKGKIELNNHFCMEQYSEFANSAQMQKRTHTHRTKPYQCLFINTPRIFAYNVYVFQSSCGLLFHKVYVWFTSPPIHTPCSISPRKYCIDFNK